MSSSSTRRPASAFQDESLDPLDEAKALLRFVEVHGSQRAVARALGKSSPWVTQRIALLKLTPEREVPRQTPRSRP
ncbi:hypothetical protein ACWD4L_25780 [Streptomyces sp. NPDC002596]